MGTKITFKRPDGKHAAGYLAKAGRAKAPGVVVIQEWWGLQDQIKGICDRFALAGYEALAPDLYAGTVVPYHDTDAAGREMNSLNFLEATDQVVRGAAQLLEAYRRQGRAHRVLPGRRGDDPRRVSACRSSLPRSASTGCRRETVAKPADVKVPLQAHFANRDDWCTPEAVDKFEAGSEGCRQERPRSSATTPTTAS